jgi:PEP-CTERM motif
VNGTWVELNTNGVQGWVSPTQFGTPGAYGTNSSYTVGFYNGDYFNNYFGFNLAGTVCDVSAPSDCFTLPSSDSTEITAAKLVVYSGQISNNLTYTLYGATSLLSQMEQGSPNADLYNEMREGTVYGTFQLPPNSTNTVAQLIFALNSAAVTDIQAAVKNQAMFAVAGYVDPPSVPEPSTWVMMLGGFAGLGLVARRRAAKRRAAAASG